MRVGTYEILITPCRIHFEKHTRKIYCWPARTKEVMHPQLQWCWTFKAYMWCVSSTLPPLNSSYSLRAAAAAHQPPSCLMRSYFSHKWFGYIQVLHPPARPHVPCPVTLLPSSFTKCPTEFHQLQKHPSSILFIFSILLIKLLRLSVFRMMCLQLIWSSVIQCPENPKPHSIQTLACTLQLWCHPSHDAHMPIRNWSSFDFSPTCSL